MKSTVHYLGNQKLIVSKIKVQIRDKTVIEFSYLPSVIKFSDE